MPCSTSARYPSPTTRSASFSESYSYPEPDWAAMEADARGWKRDECAPDSTQQSPIDIASTLLEVDPLLKLKVTGSTIVAKRAEGTPQVDFELIKPNVQWTSLTGLEKDPCLPLTSAHFHAPSEHLVDGNSFDMEMHMKHLAPAPIDGVIGVVVTYLFRVGGKENDWFGKLLKILLDRESAEQFCIYPKEPMKVARYKGSLTTPPCTRNVLWFVDLEPIVFSEAQMGLFQGNTELNRRCQKIESDTKIKTNK